MGITRGQFNNAIESCGFTAPSSEVYDYFNSQTSSFSLDELAMFLAHLIHESGGFQHTEEEKFAGIRDHREYSVRGDCSQPGKVYHGRGYIQLTWAANYRDASRDLGMGDELLRNPERVANETYLAMRVSVWYWTERVRREVGSVTNMIDCFGKTTKAINGALESSAGYNSRYQYYLKVADVLGVQNKARE
ncbi:chitinase 4-like [Ischnura elegans]|uniref:chitinase 4-like n=1 Tax=Ischnura elegans TaxID=197161 RepID=UPI001ED86D03|nr:chitinase 4-like [Ischnura elegans]